MTVTICFHRQASNLLRDSSLGENPVNFVVSRMQILTTPQVKHNLAASANIGPGNSGSRLCIEFCFLVQLLDGVPKHKENHLYRPFFSLKSLERLDGKTSTLAPFVNNQWFPPAS